MSSIPAQSHTFLKIDYEIFSRAILLSAADSKRVVFSYKRNYVLKVLVNHLVKLTQEKSVVSHDHPNMTIAVAWDVKIQTKPKKSICHSLDKQNV